MSTETYIFGFRLWIEGLRMPRATKTNALSSDVNVNIVLS